MAPRRESAGPASAIASRVGLHETLSNQTMKLMACRDTPTGNTPGQSAPVSTISRSPSLEAAMRAIISKLVHFGSWIAAVATVLATAYGVAIVADGNYC